KADYDSGKLLYGDGDYAGARVKFQAAFDLSQDPRLLWNMAACEKGQRHYAKVVTLVKKYLELGGALLGEDDRKDANDLLSAIESFTVGLAINVDEAGAQIFVDGEPVGESPLAVPVTVDIGTRQIEVKKPGFAPFSRTVPVGGTKQAVLDVKLTREVHEGVLAVGAPAKATIFIDSKAVGVGSFVGNLASGGHTLRVDAPGFRSYQSEVVIQDHERRDVDVVLEPIAAASAAPAEPEGALHGLELGAYLGYGTQSNHMHVDIDNNNGSNGMTQGQDQTATVNFIPIGIDIGYRLGRPTYLGIFGEVGTLDRSGTCGVARHGPNEDFPGDPAVRYGYTNCVMFKAGVVLAFHLLPRTIVDPYFGFEAAVHASDAHFRSFDPLTGQTTDGTDSNGSFQPAFRIGVDSHPLPGLGAGIFARLGPVFGGEGKPSDSNGNNCPQNNSQQNGSTSACPTVNTSTDVGTQVSFGIRAAYTFQ
ncbi:MAG TPA: PEGA domain-containing protein, partial [Polyangiaceae bacterium]